MRTFIVILLLVIVCIFGYSLYRTIQKGKEFVSAMANREIPPSAYGDTAFYDWCLTNYEQLAYGFNHTYPGKDVSTDEGAMLYYMYCEDQYYNFSDVIEKSKEEDDAELEAIDKIEEDKRRFSSD